jgi:hypothetical protein
MWTQKKAASATDLNLTIGMRFGCGLAAQDHIPGANLMTDICRNLLLY